MICEKTVDVLDEYNFINFLNAENRTNNKCQWLLSSL